MPFKKIEDGTDDTEGNMPLKRVVGDGVDEDAEGHGFRHGAADAVDDTEGNMPRIRIATDGVEDADTEGNMPVKRGVADGVDEGDDTEGNRIKIIR
jgi:hypothetical protein